MFTPRYGSSPGELGAPSQGATTNLRTPMASFDILSTDHDRARKFYADMFGWVVSVNTNVGADGSVEVGSQDWMAGGDIDSVDGAGAAVYVRVHDLDVALARAAELGGKTLAPLIDLPHGCGQVAIFADPDGNQVGLWAAATRRQFTDSTPWI